MSSTSMSLVSTETSNVPVSSSSMSPGVVLKSLADCDYVAIVVEQGGADVDVLQVFVGID